MSEVRHEWVDELCSRLERVLIGRAAEELLAAPLPEHAALVVAPVWRWLPPRIDMGRKTRRADGNTMLMPVRMTWQPGPLTLVAAPTELAWSMIGLGYSGTGQLKVYPAAGAGPLVLADDFPTDGELAAPLLPRRALDLRLRELVADGHQARWDALMSLEWYVQRAVRSAVVSVSYDLAGPDCLDPTWVLGESGEQAVSDRMLLGTADNPGRVHALLERCLRPRAFVRVDPLRYVVTDLHRSAEAEVRKAIGDPHIGRKIRAVRRAMPSAPLQDVIAAYRIRHPGDLLSTARATQALSSGADVMAAFTGLSDVDAAIPSHEDAVLAKVDEQRRARV